MIESFCYNVKAMTFLKAIGNPIILTDTLLTPASLFYMQI